MLTSNEIKQKIISRTLQQDQTFVREMWAKTFFFNKDDVATPMARILFACLAKGDFEVTSQFNPQKKQHWKCPSPHLYAIDYMSHASRVIIDYDQLSESNKVELLNFFPKEKSYARISSHDVSRKNGELVESKSLFQSLVGYFFGNHYGVDIAMGGEGQTNLMGKRIKRDGSSGHLYYYRNDNDQLILVGLEQTAPSSQVVPDQFEQSSSSLGSSDTYTAAGSLYFSNPIFQLKLLNQDISSIAEYGGMKVEINDDNWPKIIDFLKELQQQTSLEGIQALLETKPLKVQEHQIPHTPGQVTPSQGNIELSELLAFDWKDFFTQLEVLEALPKEIKKFKEIVLKNFDEFKKNFDKNSLKNIATEIEPLSKNQALTKYHPIFDSISTFLAKINAFISSDEMSEKEFYFQRYSELIDENNALTHRGLDILNASKIFYPGEADEHYKDYLGKLDAALKIKPSLLMDNEGDPNESTASYVDVRVPDQAWIEELSEHVTRLKNLVESKIWLISDDFNRKLTEARLRTEHQNLEMQIAQLNDQCNNLKKENLQLVTERDALLSAHHTLQPESNIHDGQVNNDLVDENKKLVEEKQNLLAGHNTLNEICTIALSHQFETFLLLSDVTRLFNKIEKQVSSYSSIKKLSDKELKIKQSGDLFIKEFKQLLKEVTSKQELPLALNQFQEKSRECIEKAMASEFGKSKSNKTLLINLGLAVVLCFVFYAALVAYRNSKESLYKNNYLLFRPSDDLKPANLLKPIEALNTNKK